MWRAWREGGKLVSSSWGYGVIALADGSTSRLPGIRIRKEDAFEDLLRSKRVQRVRFFAELGLGYVWSNSTLSGQETLCL